MADEPSSAAASAPPEALQALVCPACGATLQNVAVIAGAKIRCLNCGTRFAAPGAQPAAATVAVLDQRSAQREPGSPGYWLLRIAGYAACAGSCILFVVLAWDTTKHIGRFTTSEFLWTVSYLPLIPWAGTLTLVFTRSLARIDAGTVCLAWRSGVVTEPLPAPKGSSLIYVAPLAVTGGVLPVIAICRGADDTIAVMTAAFYGAFIFYLGFALEDFRQFIWRQEQLARACCKATGVAFNSSAADVFPLSGLLLAIAVVVLALIAISTGPSMESAYIMLALLAAAASLYVIGGTWDRAAVWWRLAGGPILRD